MAGGVRQNLLDKWKRTTVTEVAADGSQRRTLTLTDPDTGLEVRAVATVYTDTPAVEWTLYFTNKGDKDTPILEQVKAVDTTVRSGVSNGVKLLRLVGSPCRVDDWLPLEDAVKPGQPIDFAPVGGRSSSDASPFFNVQWPGGGVITAIGWSGQWAATVKWTKDGRVNISAGMQTMHLKLHPGETIRSPRILQLYWFGDDPWRGYNQFRHVMFAHIMPRIDGHVGHSADRPLEHLVLRVEQQHRSQCAFAFGGDARGWASRCSGSMPIGSRAVSAGGVGQLRISDRARRAARSFSSRHSADQRRRPQGRHEVSLVVRA